MDAKIKSQKKKKKQGVVHFRIIAYRVIVLKSARYSERTYRRAPYRLQMNSYAAAVSESGQV